MTPYWPFIPKVYRLVYSKDVIIVADRTRHRKKIMKQMAPDLKNSPPNYKRFLQV